MAQNLLVRGMNNMLLDAREDRLINEILTEGLFEPGDEFRVQQQASPNMTVRVGSGSVGDRYVVEGPGGTYLVRNPDPWIGSGNGDLPIANGDPTFDRIDGIDLVVYDDSIDSSGRSEAQVVVTQGTPASVPDEPDLPTDVAAVTRLATVLVEAGESTSIVTGDITDTRVANRAWTAPRGFIASADFTSNAGPFSTVTDIGQTLTWDAEDGRRYRVQWHMPSVTASAAGTYVSVHVADGSNTIVHGLVTFRGSQTADETSMSASYVEAPGAGTITRKLRAQADEGTGQLQGSATRIRTFSVEDIGGFLP